MTIATTNDVGLPSPVDDPRGVALGLLYREAHALDEGRWDEWLALYTEDARFWAPAWIDEHKRSDDPERQVSIIYHDTRRGLEERVQRAGSRKSVTTLPLPRTLHLVSNIEIVEAASDQMTVRSAGTVTSFNPRTSISHTNHLRYTHALRHEVEGWRIAAKTIILINDRMPAVLDFYSI